MRCSETGRGRCAKCFGGWSRSRRILPPSISARSLETSIGTFFVSFPAANLDSFTMPSSSSSIEDWKGLIRGQHRYFSAAVRWNSHWVTANEAERLAHMAGGGFWILSRGPIRNILIVRTCGGRTEYWIRRESLNQWIATRDAGTRALHAPCRSPARLGPEEHPLLRRWPQPERFVTQ